MMKAYLVWQEKGEQLESLPLIGSTPPTFKLNGYPNGPSHLVTSILIVNSNFISKDVVVPFVLKFSQIIWEKDLSSPLEIVE